MYNMIKENPRISQKALSSQLGFGIKMIRDSIEILRKDGKIRREGPDKTGKWVIEEDDNTLKKPAENGGLLSFDEVSDDAGDEAGGGVSGGVSVGVSGGVSGGVSVGVGGGVALKQAVLLFCAEPRSKPEIQEHLGIKSERYVREKLINPLLAEGKLRRTEKSLNSKKQRYVTE